MIVYVDSSAMLRVLFGHSGAYNKFNQWDEAASSELLHVECNRTLYRLRMENKITDETMSDYQSSFEDFLETISIIDVNSTVMSKAAGPFPTVIGSLDAVHLATALLWKEEREEDIHMLTHDVQLAVAAKASGMKVIG